VRARFPLVRELVVALVGVIFWADLSMTNAAMPAALRWHSRPQWMAFAVMYPRVLQSWSMFSPDAPLSDYMVVVDAVTRDGRHVDPLNEVGSRIASLPVGDIPPRLGHSSVFCDYMLRIPDTAVYHQAFIEWMIRYPERTGRPRDEIVSFKAWNIEHASPPPGEREPTGVRRRLFLEWPPPQGRR
jgi:hypothetical protein